LIVNIRTRHKIALARQGYRLIHLGRKIFGQTDHAVVKRSGLMWDLDLSQVIDFCIYLFGGFEVRTANLYKNYIKPGDIVLDIGANIGSHTLPMAQLARSRGRVIALEPTAYAFQKLQKNIALNPQTASCVTAKQVMLVAAADKTVMPEIYSSWPLEPQGSIHEVHGGELKSTAGAEAQTLDEIVASLNLAKVNFIKIDVDGHEFRVLSGAMNTLKKFHPVMIMELEPHLYVTNPAEFDGIFTLLAGLGASMSDVLTGQIMPMNGHEIRKIIPDGSSRNVLIKFH
jgi:FkbM family methyltransferase